MPKSLGLEYFVKEVNSTYQKVEIRGLKGPFVLNDLNTLIWTALQHFIQLVSEKDHA